MHAPTNVEVHPNDIPISKTYLLSDVKNAEDAVSDMVTRGFRGKAAGFRVLMPKDKRIAKRIGYTVTTGVSYGLRKKGESRDVKYWTYHYDADHYAIVLVDSAVAEKLGL